MKDVAPYIFPQNNGILMPVSVLFFPYLPLLIHQKIWQLTRLTLFLQTDLEKMLETIYLTVGIVAICVLFLCVGIIIKGRFPSMHVSGNKEMQKRGIGCVQSQDREARKKNKHAIAEIEKEERENN